MSLILDEHRQYLADSARLDGFRRAIDEVVRPGDVVVDLGAGTGVLGFLACRAGAARVYAFESTSFIGVARDLCRANGFAERVTLLKEYSPHAVLPEPADVVVADQIGRFGFEAGVFEYFADARRRFLKPGGLTIPSRINFIGAPVETEDMWGRITFWDESPAGLKIAAGRTIARNTGYPVKYSAADLLADPAVLASLDPSAENEIPIRAKAIVSVTRAGTMHGVGGWFDAQLSPGSTMTNSPLSSARIDRHNVYFPIDNPVAVAIGDRIDIDMRIVTAQVMVQWTVTVHDVEGRLKASSKHSTFNGMLVCKEDMRTTRPDFRPNLTPRGQARLSVLSLCDGQRSLASVENEVQRRHSDLFPKPEDAAVFVAEVVTRYTV